MEKLYYKDCDKRIKIYFFECLIQEKRFRHGILTFTREIVRKKYAVLPFRNVLNTQAYLIT